MEKAPQNLELITAYFQNLSPIQINRFEKLGPLYKEWNEKINVVSRKDIDGLYLKHVLHSLSIAKIFQFEEGKSIIDIGTGGGFPGIPLAILFPEVQFHLVDSIRKKLTIVEAVVESLSLNNVTVEHARAETLSKKFDFAVSRAVTALGPLWKWSKPLIYKKTNTDQPNGLICLKGGDLAQEIYESGLRPNIYRIEEIFKEEFFFEKFILFVKR